jgi:hypothetical protein
VTVCIVPLFIDSQALIDQVSLNQNKYSKIPSRSFGIMGGHGNCAFNFVVKLSLELG